MRKTYHIWTIGCQMNVADSRHLASQLESLGLSEAASVDEAGVVVLNTCVVRQQPEDKARNRLQSLKPLKKQNPEIVIALMGCMVGEREAETLPDEYPFVDFFLEPSKPDQLVEFLRSQCGDKVLPAMDELQDYHLPDSEENAVCAFVPITLGCSHVCSYCVIPYRRGPDRSRAPEVILREVGALAAQGVREVTLLGQIVDRYGMELEGWNLARLLHEVCRIDGLLRVRFMTSHPAYMDDELIQAVADEPKLCPYFELPFQAGSNRILKEMRRGYTREEYIQTVGNIRAKVPEAGINTDIIVGYPTESEEDFMETFRLLEELRLDVAHIAKYSPRPRTLSARQDDDVPPEEKERRRVLLDELARSILTEKNKKLEGETVTVLVEGFQQKTGRWRGRTAQGNLVFAEAAGTEDLAGRLLPVRISWAGPYSMIGDVDESKRI
ncbi:MAG: tRNA (N6-isopentenyl adenosine(37)-C2)-methylthiotransferase MiaB [Kiritimatiellales bacterium]|nr:tRNA (N6-isopentenyl adenosine(37)-C2)-methylthiotransferase MiaB [Kiritimatiellales bacterium]